MSQRERYDVNSKWMIQHHTPSILYLDGQTGVRAWKPLQAELVHPKELPDGLVEVFFDDRPESTLFLVEMATYPERRLEDQLRNGALLTLLEKGVLPEVLVVVLRERGRYRVPSHVTVPSPRGLSSLTLTWRVVELWTLSAADLLAAGHVGLVPWVPLTRFTEPPEVVLRQCRAQIDQLARPEEHANLLAVTQVFAGLRYNDPSLLALFGGKPTMIDLMESYPVRQLVEERVQQRVQEVVEERVQQRVQEVVEERVQAVLSERLRAKVIEQAHEHIAIVLAARFGPVPPEVLAALKGVQDEARLRDLFDGAARCPDLAAFQARLVS